MMIRFWLVPYTLSMVFLLLLGTLDYFRGEAPGELTIATYLLAVLAYPFLPVPVEYKALLFAMHLTLLLVITLLYLKGGIGLMDFVIAPNLPLLLINPVRISHLYAGLVGATIALVLHLIRARGRCGGRLVPGGVITVKGKYAQKYWFYFPLGVHAEIPDEELARIKESWKKKNCVKVRFVVPLVWIYALFHVTAAIVLVGFYL